MIANKKKTVATKGTQVKRTRQPEGRGVTPEEFLALKQPRGDQRP